MEQQDPVLPHITVSSREVIVKFLLSEKSQKHELCFEDDSLDGFEIFTCSKGLITQVLLSKNQNITVERASIRYDKEMSMVYLCLRKSARHEWSLELDTFKEEIMLDFDSTDKIFGMAIFNVNKYFDSQFLKKLTTERFMIPVHNQVSLQEESVIKASSITINDREQTETTNFHNGKKLDERPPLLVSICNGDLKTVKEIFEKDKNLLYQVDGKGGNAVTLSAAFGHLDILLWVIDKGLTLKSCRNDGATPLLQAALHGHINVIQWLIENGIDIDESDDNGDTAVAQAAGGGHVNIVEWLIEHKANITLKSKSGSTALHRAATSGHLDVVKYIVSTKKLPIDEKTCRGCTALHYAARNRHNDIVRWLVEEGGASIMETDKKGNCLEHIVGKTDNMILSDWLHDWKKKLTNNDSTQILK